MIKVDYWQNCYDGQWKGLIVDEAFSHPAKFSRNLIARIYRHALESGLIQPGATVVDPFGGAGLGAIDALQNNLNWVGVELEPRFVAMGQGCDCTGISKADWVRFYGRWEKGANLDGRRWCPRCLAEAVRILPSKNGQASFFEETLTTSYTQDSGQIPHTTPHRYTGNIELWRKRYPHLTGSATLLQGDSRHLTDVIAAAGLVVGSPPFSPGQSTGGEVPLFLNGAARSSNGIGHNYGSSPGQLASLPPGQLSAVIASPPFAGNTGGRGEASRNGIDAALFDRHSGGMKKGTGDDPANLDHLPMGTPPVMVVGSPPYANGEKGHPSLGSVNKDDWGNDGRDIAGRRGLNGNYGSSSGQLAEMKPGDIGAIIASPPYADGCAHTGGDDPNPQHIQGSKRGAYGVAIVASPPFAGSIGSDDPDKRGGLFRDEKRRGDVNLTGSYGQSEGQLGAMVVGSPPYGNNAADTGYINENWSDGRKRPIGASQRNNQGYGLTDGQLGQESPDTFWAAAKIIVEQCWQILPEGGAAIWVLKAYVKDKKIVDFPGQWRALCEACGFETIHEHRAMLVKNNGYQATIDGGLVDKSVARKSFFRRLAEKNGSPEINWETVLCMRKVTQNT